MAGRNVEFVTTIPGRCALSVNNADMPTPKGWAWTLLTNVAQLESGHTPSRNHPEYWDGDIPWIGIKDARAHHGGVINDTLQSVTQAGINNSAARILPIGTVCLSRTASIGYVVTMGRPMATSQDFVNWVCSPAIDPDYLKWIFRAEGEEGLRRFGKGTTHTTIYFPEVKAFHACIAPLNEQRRIAAKLEAIFQQTRAAKARLERLPALLEKLKRSVLAAAFRGDLTADWRAAHPDVEPASKLVDRLKNNRGEYWGKASSARTAESDGPAELHGLPASWTWARSGEIVEPGADIVYGIVQPGPVIVNGVPYVRGTDIQNGCILERQLLRTHPDIAARYERASLRGGDVLLGIIRATKVAIVPASLEGANITQGTARFRPGNGIGTKFLAAWLEGPSAQDWLHSHYRGIDMPGLNLQDVRRLPVPVAPPEEQSVIVEKLGRAMRAVERLQRAVERAAHGALQLEQAALAKAFRGELVTQNPCDEPAAVLLERIGPLVRTGSGVPVAVVNRSLPLCRAQAAS